MNLVQNLLRAMIKHTKISVHRPIFKWSNIGGTINQSVSTFNH